MRPLPALRTAALIAIIIGIGMFHPAGVQAVAANGADSKRAQYSRMPPQRALATLTTAINRLIEKAGGCE